MDLDARLAAVVAEGERRCYSTPQVIVGHPQEGFGGLLGVEGDLAEIVAYVRRYAADRRSERRTRERVVEARLRLDAREEIAFAVRRVGRELTKSAEAAAILEVASRILDRDDLAFREDDRAILAEGVGPLRDPDRYPGKELRVLVLLRDGFVCVECGSDRDLSVDHIVPWSKGGETTEENLQTLCRPCNSRKGAKLPTRSATVSIDTGP